MNKFLFQAISRCFSSIIFNTCTITLVLNILNSTNRHFKVEKQNIKECANAREIERESRATFLSPRPTPASIMWPTVPYAKVSTRVKPAKSPVCSPESLVSSFNHLKTKCRKCIKCRDHSQTPTWQPGTTPLHGTCGTLTLYLDPLRGAYDTLKPTIQTIPSLVWICCPDLALAT